jgi:putative transposase
VRDSFPKAGIARLCNLLGKTRHAYYDAQWRTEQQAVEHAVILELVGEIRQTLPRIGTEKIYYMLEPSFQAHGIKLGRDGLHQLLIEQGLSIRKRKRKPKTTNSKHWMKKYPNLIKEWVPFSPDMLWVCDITFLTL